MTRFLNLVILLVWLAALALASASGATAATSVAVDGKRKSKRNLALLIGQPIPIHRAERRILNFGPRREFMYVNPNMVSNYHPSQLINTSRRKLHSGPAFPIRFEPMIQYSQTDPLYENDFGASKYIKNDLSTGDSNYEQYAHGHGHSSNLEQSYGMHDSEPIIEIIIKESNETLPPAPHQTPIWTQKDTTTPKKDINVFYVPYQKNPNGKGKNSIIYGKPVPALTPIEHHQTESEDGKIIEHSEQPKPTEAPLDWYKNQPTTTLRAIIKPDTEQHLLVSKKLKITFSDSKADLDGSQNVWPNSNDRSVLEESSPPFVYAQKPPLNFNRPTASNFGIKKPAIPQPPFFDGPRLQLQLPQFFPRIPISYLTPPPIVSQFHSHPQLPPLQHQPHHQLPQTHTQPQPQPPYHHSVDQLQQRPHFVANVRKPASFGPQQLPFEQTVNIHSNNHHNIDSQKKVVSDATPSPNSNHGPGPSPSPSPNVDHTNNLAPLIANGDFGEIFQSHPKYEQHLVSDSLYSSFVPNSPTGSKNYYNNYYSTTSSPHFYSTNLEKTRTESNKGTARQQSPSQFPSTTTTSTTTTTTTTTPTPSQANKSHFQLPQIGEEKLKQNSAKLPDEVPADLREQLLASGVLDNADITVLDYDKVGSIPIEKLPADQLAHFLSAGGQQQIVAAGSEPVSERVEPASNSPNRKSDRDPVQMKIVRYDAKNENDYANKYIEPGAQKIRPVHLNDRGYNRYLPLHINGTHFPIPDELADRNISSVVVLAPIDYQFRTMKKRNLDRASHENGIEVDAFLGRLVMSPSRENFRKWLEFEKKAAVKQQSIVFLVVAKDSQNNEIYKYDVTNDHVKLTDDKLSEKYVEAALANKIKKNKFEN